MARSVNTHPTLNIEHVNRWNARIGPDHRKRPSSDKKSEGPPKARKEDPIDPEDDFMIETDPADKPIDEATIDDAMDALIENGENDWIVEVDDEPSEVLSTAEVLDVIYDTDDPGEAFTEYFKAAEEEVKRMGLPRAITRDMLYEIGMHTDVDYEIDTHTNRAVFMDNFLNELVVQAYEAHLQSIEVDPADGIDRNTMVKTIINAYNNATSHNSNYEYYHWLFMDQFGIEETYSDKGNPIGDYKVFDEAFKKVFKEGYKGHVEGEENQFLIYNSYYELLSDQLPDEYEKRLENRNAARRRENLKRKIRREYEKKYPDIAHDDELTSKEKLSLMDGLYETETGVSLLWGL